MKKLISYLNQIDPRIKVVVYTQDDLWVIEAGIENEFTCIVQNESFRKAKKQFYKTEVTLQLALAAAELQAFEEAEAKKKARLLKEREEALEKEFQELWNDLELFGYDFERVISKVEKANTIRSCMDVLK